MQLDTALTRIAALAFQEGSTERGTPLEGVASPSGAEAAQATDEWGRYAGLPPTLQLLEGGREARVVEALSYHGPDGREWDVPAGEVVNGASIPRPFWALTGGPWSGPYRNASIVHDSWCAPRDATWQDAHRMFYHAMRCSRVSAFRAKVMFYAVYRFGPRWADPADADMLEGLGESAAGPVIQLQPIEPHAGELACDAEHIFAHEPTLEEIVALAESREAQG